MNASEFHGSDCLHTGRRDRCDESSQDQVVDCYDNAFMESCFGTIKTELEMTEYETVPEGERELGSYFSYYNRDRKHSSLGYQTPAQFESTQPGQC